MKLLPEILSVARDGDAVEFELRIAHDLGYFEGHFPGLPILPGVVQIDWAAKLAGEHFGLGELRADTLKAVKFSAPLIPERIVTLRLRWHPDAARLDFEYRCPLRKYSSGQLLLARAEA